MSCRTTCPTLRTKGGSYQRKKNLRQEAEKREGGAGGKREGSGQKSKRGGDSYSAAADVAAVRIGVRGTFTRSAENASQCALIGELKAGWGAMQREVQQKAAKEITKESKACLVRKLAEANARIAVLESEAAAAHPASRPTPNPVTASNPRLRGPTPTPAPTPAPEPKQRKYNSYVTRMRAVKKLRMFLGLYPPEAHADLVARAIVVDGRGKRCGISVSLVRELFANPRMAVHMKAYAEVCKSSLGQRSTCRLPCSPLLTSRAPVDSVDCHIGSLGGCAASYRTMVRPLVSCSHHIAHACP